LKPWLKSADERLGDIEDFIASFIIAADMKLDEIEKRLNDMGFSVCNVEYALNEYHAFTTGVLYSMCVLLRKSGAYTEKEIKSLFGEVPDPDLLHDNLCFNLDRL
jgi:hypothetical protein